MQQAHHRGAQFRHAVAGARRCHQNFRKRRRMLGERGDGVGDVFFEFCLLHLVRLGQHHLIAHGGFIQRLEYVLVDILDASHQAAGWPGLIAAHGAELITMLFVVIIARFIISWLSAVVEEQTINIGFYNLVRWQSYAYVIRQSLSFFQNDFSGAIASKVWQSGGAVGDFMVALLQVVWFIAIYAVTTFALLAALDWRLGLAIAIWIVLFSLLARHYVPRMRRASATAAESASALTGRIVDSYANIQTLKLFGTAEADDRFVRSGYDNFIETITRLPGSWSGAHLDGAPTGLMITGIGVLCVTLDRGIITVGGVALAWDWCFNLQPPRPHDEPAQPDALLRPRTLDLSAGLWAVDAPDAKPL